MATSLLDKLGAKRQTIKPSQYVSNIVEPYRDLGKQLYEEEAFTRKEVKPLTEKLREELPQGTLDAYETRRDTRLMEQDIARKQEKEAKETASERAKMLERQLSDKYGIEVKRSFSPIQFTNMVMKIPADRREQFKKDYQEYTLEIERSNPFRAGAESGFNVLPTQLETTEGKETVIQAPNFNVGRFVGGAGQQLAFGSVLGAPIESTVGRVLPKATPFVTETIKDVAIGTGTQLLEAPFDKPSVSQFAANTALDIALNALFGVVGKSLAKVNAIDLKNAKTAEIVENVAKDMNVTPKEASDMIDKSIDDLMQMRTQTPRVEPMLAPRAEMRTDTTAVNLRQPQQTLQPKTRKENLTPIVYHGTGEAFETFNKKMQGSNYRTGQGGFFFTNNERSAGNYAKISARNVGGKERIISAKLDFKNPLVLGPYDDVFDFYDNHVSDILRNAEDGSNDGIIVKSTDGKRDLYVALDEKQIIQETAQPTPQPTIERPSEFTVRPKKLTEKLAEPIKRGLIGKEKISFDLVRTSNEEILSGVNETIKYNPSLDVEARYFDGKIEVGEKFFNLPSESKSFVLTHEIAHSMTEQLPKSEIDAMVDIFEDVYKNRVKYESILGTNAYEKNYDELATDLITKYIYDPTEFKKTYPQAFELAEALATGKTVKSTSIFNQLPPKKQIKEMTDLENQIMILEDVKSANPEMFENKGWQSKLDELKRQLSQKPVIERPAEVTFTPKKLTEKLAEDVGIESDRINVPLPRQPEARAPRQTTPEGLKFRQTIENSFMKSEMPEESKQIFDEIPEVYEQVRNQEVWDRAFENVSRNVDDAINRFESKLSLESADDTAEAIAIMNRLADVNDISTLDRVARTMAERATRAGQAVQAIVMLQRTTPEGKLVQAHNVIKNITDKMKEETPALYDKLLKEGKLPELSPDDSKFIVETMKKAQDLTGRAKEIEIAKVDQLLANKIPSTFGDKFRALRNLSLLGNFKTIATRNPLGNVIFSGLENISQIPSGLTDKMLSAWLKTPRTTKVVPDLLAQGKGFKKGLTEALEDIKLNVDTSPTRGGAELPRNREVFKKSVLAAANDMLGNPVKLAKFLEVSWLNKANNWLGDALKLGDRPFYQAAYEARLKELKELQPNADIKDLEKLAQDFGLDRVFQNQGATAEALSMVKRGMNKLNVKGVGLGDIVMPYTQTPANILAKGAQYTPLNLINMGKIALGSGQGSVKKNIANNQKTFSDAVGRLFTGTGLIALGWTLAKNGYVTGRQTDTSKKAKELKRNVGEQQYSIKIGDTWYSYDWAQPASVPLAVGIDAYNAGANETDLLSMIEKATISGGQTLVEQGMLQNITRLFGGYSPVENVIETIVTSPTQLSPTLGSQLAQATDPFKRDVDYSSAGTQLMTTLQKKNPLFRQNLPATLDIWGQPAVEQQGKGSVQKALDTFINPSFVSKQTEDKTTLEIYRLFTETKDTDVIPSYTPSALKTPNEIRNFKEIYGELAKRKVESIMNSSKYKGSSDKTKAELIADALEDVRTSAKDQYNKKYKTDL